jgi:Tfp pilus assembly protein PilF/ketosteroid isomerase-like protein
MPFRLTKTPCISHGLMACALVLGAAVAAPVAAQTAVAASAVTSAVASPESAEIQRLIKDGQHDKALKLIDESLAKNPRDPQMRFRRGVALSMLDRKAEALAVFQKLVEDHPDMPAPYNNMAVILGAQGDYEKARQSLEKAIRTNPAYATAYQNLGDVYAQLASQAYTKALQLDKGDNSVQPKLALLRELTAGANVPPPPAPPAPAAAKPGAKPASLPPPPPTVAASPTPAPTVAAAPAASKPVAAIASASASKPAVAASVAAAKPAATPAPAPASAISSASAAKPGNTPTPTPASATGTSDVEAAVRNWAAAWSKRDMAAYYAAYTPDFRGQTASRKAWEQDRRDRIATRKQIKVELQDLKITVEGEEATARFRQVYASDALSTTGRKTLQLVRLNGHWLIKQEAVGG